MSFNVSQKDRSILDRLQKTFKCGIIKIRKRDGLHSYDVTKPQDIIQTIIPYFRKYELLSESKKRNFAIFCKIAALMNLGEHKNAKGLRKILELRERINVGKGRTINIVTGIFGNNIESRGAPQVIRLYKPTFGVRNYRPFDFATADKLLSSPA